jgi:hypothetical protein
MDCELKFFSGVAVGRIGAVLAIFSDETSGSCCCSVRAIQETEKVRRHEAAAVAINCLNEALREVICAEDCPAVNNNWSLKFVGREGDIRASDFSKSE